MIQAHTDERTIPALLRDRLAAALADLESDGQASGVHVNLSDAPDEALACLAAGEAMLVRVLREDCASRDTALDLLTADALVTRAFERAADSPASLPGLAEEAMRRIARLGGTVD